MRYTALLRYGAFDVALAMGYKSCVQELAKWCSPLKAGSAWDRRDQKRVGTTRKVRVVIEGVGYESISAAARALGRSTVAVDLMLRDGRAMKA